MKYYDLATGEFDTYNWGAEKIEKVAAILGVSEEEIYKAVESKIRPLELELQEVSADRRRARRIEEI